MAQGQAPWLADVTRNECRSFYLLSEIGNRDSSREEKRGKGLRFERTDGVSRNSPPFVTIHRCTSKRKTPNERLTVSRGNRL